MIFKGVRSSMQCKCSAGERDAKIAIIEMLIKKTSLQSTQNTQNMTRDRHGKDRWKTNELQKR